jgi:hypothetical protein
LSVFIPILLTIVLAFSIVPSVSATTVKIQPPSADNFMINDTHDDSDDVTNHGGNTRLLIGHAPAPYAYRALVKFDLSSIPSGSTINKATLYMYFDLSMSFGFPITSTFNAYPVKKDWLELESSWVNAKIGIPWGAEGGDYNTGISASTSGGNSGGDEWFSWDVTNIVSYWITDGNPNYGFLIKHPTDGNEEAAFRSKEYPDTSAPYLEIEYSSHAVGGFFAPTNKLAILAPYIALVGLIGAVSTIFAIRRWHKD